ncbi:BatD family protein [Bradyrhizobium sp. Tv2a-2]|uniref:BatD family protein n=1 Tax=Bradyrhizobium sp. Tv2a-2 TaxID=113395 RepID=UPI000413EC6B|nr:BatD family protein [Bradyrhizobium sp. Tv2a-2]
MRNWAIAIVLLLAPSLPLHDARAQQDDAAKPAVRVTIDPSRVVVGQQTRLRIDVLAPNYMTAPPELPGFQLRNATTRQLQSVNINEQHDGITYAGVRFEFAIYPLEPGSYSVADQTVTVRYAAEPPATREVAIALPRISLEAFIPNAASALRPFLAANRLTIEQTVRNSSDQLKVGDSVTRIVTVKAAGTPAMLLPPQQFAAVEGLALYPAQPALDDQADSRTDETSSTRVDSATYMLEKPGDYALPAIDVRWWNVQEKKVDLAHLDAVTLHVAADPTATGAAAAGETGTHMTWEALIDFVADHWRLVIPAVAIVAVMAWFAPRVWKRIAILLRQRRETYLQSEAYAFGLLRRAVHHRDARTTYFLLLEWLQRFEPVAPYHSVDALKAAARDPALDRQLGAIEDELFAPQHIGDGCSRRLLLRRISAARRGLRRRTARGGRPPLPRELNPIGGEAAPTYRGRKPAR